MAKHYGNKTKPEHPVRWVRVDECGTVWADAQRASGVNESMVKTICNELDPDGLGILQLAEKNGHKVYHLIDGRHRWTALMRLGYGDQLVLAEIHDIHTAKEAATLFKVFNKVKSQTALDKFLVSLTAGDERENEINRIVKAHGFYIRNTDSPRAIVAVRALSDVYRYGPDVLAQTLVSIKATWRDDVNARRGDIISGLGLLIALYGGQLDYSRLHDRLAKKYSAAELIGTCQSQKKILSCSGTRAFVWLVARCYNQGLKTDAQLVIA